MYKYVQDLNGMSAFTLATSPTYNWAAELSLAGDIKFDGSRRYYLRFQAAEFEERGVPDVLINRIRAKEHIQCQTLSLLKFNQRISDSVNEVVMQSDSVIKQLLEKIRLRIPAMFKVCEGIALVDMLASFAYLVTSRDYVRPGLGDTLALQSARHPILEAVMSSRVILFWKSLIYCSFDRRSSCPTTLQQTCTASRQLPAVT